MKFKIRFFLDQGEPLSDQFCIAEVTSKYVPKSGNLIYLPDYIIALTMRNLVTEGVIYKVKSRIFNYSDENEEQLSSVEVHIVKTNL